jgi:GTP pyrophosphokinase
METHGVQSRTSGAPYFQHPLEVARILTELKFDTQTIAAGLLHDVLEDTNVSFEELEEIFGARIAFLVEGVTKLSKINCSLFDVRQVKNFQKFILTILQDIRVLIVKLVDRLHNMRTLGHIPSKEKRNSIARETLEIYAPLAGRIGMNIIKDEMEDLAFSNLHPEEHSNIFSKLNRIHMENNNFVQSTILELKRIFKEAGVNADISGREKRAWSIWRKMQKSDISFERINDVMAFRIIVDTKQQCYISLGLIHTNFQIIPGRFKDYISVPKLNGYRSLHTTVVGLIGQGIEIQIRTKEMHREANEGIAAHWSYKSNEIIPQKDESGKYKWIRNLIAIHDNSETLQDVMNYSKLEMFNDEVFCFTPNGDLIALPRGATIIDFAYGIHTSVGSTCIGAKINSEIVPLQTVLRNGDLVEIITSPHSHPDGAWEKFVVTGKAKLYIRKFIRTQEKKEFSALGLQLVKYVFSSTDVQFSEDLLDLKKFSCDSVDKFYYNVGKGIIFLRGIQTIIPRPRNSGAVVYKSSVCLEEFIPGIAVHFSECCRPILGDKIIGVLVPQKGIVVHVVNCDSIEKNYSSVVKMKWRKEEEIDSEFVVKLNIVVLNLTESFERVTNIISSNEAKIINIKMENRSTDFFDLIMDIQVKGISHLESIQASLRYCSNVKSVRKL